MRELGEAAGSISPFYPPCVLILREWIRVSVDLQPSSFAELAQPPKPGLRQ